MEHHQHPGWYAAFKAKDARFDGRIFVGVSSTGIYCRPVCRARLPKAQNCTFYATAAQAEQAGYRPCLVCRPELAPGASRTDAVATLARRAARLLEEECSGGHSLESLASRLGCTGRHLRRAFAAQYGVSPVQYLQTSRLLLAKSLLTDTSLPVLDVALAAGFGSLRRFNDLFQKRYRLSPTALRKKAAAGPAQPTGQHNPQAALPGQGSPVTLTLGYRPPYPWQQMLDFLALRAIPGVESVRDGVYRRTLRLSAGDKTVAGRVQVAHLPGKNALSVTLDAALLPALPQVLARVRHLFDLGCDPAAVYETLSAMNDIRPGLCVLGTRLPGCFDAFEMALRAVLGQQITVKAARTLASRLVQAFGTPLDAEPGTPLTAEPGTQDLTHTFPPPGTFLALQGPIEGHLGPLGVTGARARVILALAKALSDGSIDFGPGARPEEEMQKLLALPGIGPWTAQYIAMRAMEWPDAFLETDAGVKKALAPRTPKEMLALAEAWRPWRSYATVNLWNSLSEAPAGTETK